MEQKFIVRPITAGDVEAWRDAVGMVRAERKYIFPGPPLPIEAAKDFVLRNIERGYPQLILEYNGMLVGWCDITPTRINEATNHVGLLGMGLLPEYRGKGFGERLLRDTLAAAETFGFTRIELGVFATNSRAIALYRKVGFVQEGTKRKFLLIDGIYIDEIQMALLRI
jgi:RimJ/RimL family protein N-acetyltransferase